MAKAAKKKQPAGKSPRLLDLAKQLPPAKQRNFIDKIAPEDREQLIELRTAYRAKQLKPHINSSYIYREAIPARLKEYVAMSTFRKWMESDGV